MAALCGALPRRGAPPSLRASGAGRPGSEARKEELRRAVQQGRRRTIVI